MNNTIILFQVNIMHML